YAASQSSDYPPLASAILWVADQEFQPLHTGIFLSIKFSILFFLFVTAGLFWLWTRDLTVSLILCFALLLNSVAFGYLDIYFAPAFIFSLWMLEERRIKWQPMIIAQPGEPALMWGSGPASMVTAARNKPLPPTPSPAPAAGTAIVRKLADRG